MSVESAEDHVKSQLKLYFDSPSPTDKSMFNTCGQLRHQSNLLLRPS